MKIRHSFFIALIGIFFYSCETTVKEPAGLYSTNQVLVTVIDTIDDINVDVVKHVAEFYAMNTQTRSSVPKKIKEIVPVKDEQGITSMYIVNYENNQGFLVLSGTNKCHPILAFNESGNFDINQAKVDGTSVWLQEQQDIINDITVLPDSIRWKNKNAWNKFFKKEIPAQFTVKAQTKSVDPELENEVGAYIEASLNQWSDEGYTIYSYGSLSSFFSGDDLEYIEQMIYNSADDRFFGGYDGTVFIKAKTIPNNSTVETLLQSQWGQLGGYKVNGCPAGCVAVAIGQIMRYHKYPTLYNWNAMAYTYPTSTTVSFFEEIGRKVNMIYTDSTSSATTPAARNAFVQYGYNQANIINHTQGRTIGELSKSRPVYMRGNDSKNPNKSEGHAWVCDGYKIIDSFEEISIMVLNRMSSTRIPSYTCVYNGNTNNTINRYFHMNWGWSGSSDGYFYEEGVDPSIYSFSINRQDIVDIFPSR